MSKKKLLLIEPHSDDGIIALGGFLEKFKSNYDMYFSLICASSMNLYHGFVSREERIKEYEQYVSHFNASWVKSEIDEFKLPLDMESKLDLIPKAKLVNLVEQLILQVKPDTLMFMGPSFHHDHTLVYEAIIAATRPTFSWTPTEIFILENPTYVHDSYPGRNFLPNTYVKLSEKDIHNKTQLFEKLFPSQVRSEGNYLSSIGIKKWAEYRGMEARCDYAEAMSLFFQKLK